MNKIEGARHARASGWLVAVAASVTLLTASLATAQESNGSIKKDANSAIVTIDNFAFTPDTLTIKSGTKVTFVNHDDIPHTVVAVDKSFRSKAMDTNESYEFTFTTPGSFDYFCGLHPHMKAKIVVTP